jgi:hypothetical protein
VADFGNRYAQERYGEDAAICSERERRPGLGSMSQLQ